MSRAKDPAAEAREASFFVLRTPLLPLGTLLEWSAGLRAPQAGPEELDAAVAADRALLRRRLAELVERPEIEEALFLASPSLHQALEYWRRDPDSKKGRRSEAALVRYLARMTARSTPFGLFSGTSVGELGESTRLELSERARYRRSSRIDMDYVYNLADELERYPELRRELRYFPNSSLYRTGDVWHLVEVRFREGWRTHHLVEIETSEYLEAVIERAAAGAAFRELAAVLVEMLASGEDDPDEEDPGEDDVAGFLDELIASQVLTSDLIPPLTGAEPDVALIARLGQLAAGAPVAARLSEVSGVLSELDARGLGAEPQAYRAAARRLEGLPRQPDLRTLFQVDLFKPAPGATLGREVVNEVRRGIEILHRLRLGGPPRSLLDSFKDAFVNRYGIGREVPLVEVLDEEAGIGFADSGSDAAPLLADLFFGGTSQSSSTGVGEREGLLLRRLEAAWAEGAREIELTPRDVERLTQEDRRPLPEAFDVAFKLAARSPEALRDGEFEILLSHVCGPSGARLLGRFCHGDPELRRRVEEHLRAEEAGRSDEIFAEIVHLPQGRMGNVIARPVLREFEIPFLGRSGAPHERQIPLTELYLSVRKDRVELFSPRLGRRISPRLSSAHGYEDHGLAPYRLLCFLQSQKIQGGTMWSWGPFENAAFLPALRYGRLLFSRARWRVSEEELAPLVRARGTERFRAVERFRAKRRLPRWVVWQEGDNELLVDFTNVLSIDSFLDGSKRRLSLVLQEPFPAPDKLVVRGPEGGFVHEIVLPMVRARDAEEEPRPKAVKRTEPSAPARGNGIRRCFPPGSEWLFAKLYTGMATVDRVLAEVVAPVVRDAADAFDDWFFLRYGDPEWHLRVRFCGDPEILMGAVWPRLSAAAAPLLAEGGLHRLALDTYEREIERYGGLEAMPLVEGIFTADSAAVLSIVEHLEEAGGDSAAEVRWRLALIGMDRLLADWGASLPEKLDLMEMLRGAAVKMFAAGKPLRLQLDRRYRDLRGELEALLEPEPGSDGLAPGRSAFAVRSEETAPLWAELRRLDDRGGLTCPLSDIVMSLLHMHVNRLARSAGHEHELVLYDFLSRLYKSELEKERARRR